MHYRGWLSLSGLAAIALACVSAGEAATEWLLLGRGPDVQVSLDTSQVATDSIGTRIRLRFDYTAPQQLQRGGQFDSVTTFTRTEIYEYIDCSARRVRDIDMKLFHTGDSVVYRPGSAFPNWLGFSEHPATAKYFDLACTGLRVSGKL